MNEPVLKCKPVALYEARARESFVHHHTKKKTPPLPPFSSSLIIATHHQHAENSKIEFED